MDEARDDDGRHSYKLIDRQQRMNVHQTLLILEWCCFVPRSEVTERRSAIGTLVKKSTMYAGTDPCRDPLSSTCTASSVAHEARAAYPAEVV